MLGFLLPFIAIAATIAAVVLSNRQDEDIKNGKTKPPNKHKWEE
jgi:hypothetical protein